MPIYEDEDDTEVIIQPLPETQVVNTDAERVEVRFVGIQGPPGPPAEGIRSDRLSAVGTQSTIANAAALNAANGALLLDSDLTLPVLAAGDVIEFRAFIAFTNSSGGARNYYPAVLLGSTNVVGSQNLSIPETTSLVKVEGSISVVTTSSQIVEASLGTQTSNSSNSIGRVIVQTTEDVSSAKAFNIGLRSNVSTNTQSAQLLFFNAWRRRS